MERLVAELGVGGRFLDVEKTEKADEVPGGDEKEPREPLVRQNSTCIARFSGRKCREQIGHAVDAIGAAMANTRKPFPPKKTQLFLPIILSLC